MVVRQWGQIRVVPGAPWRTAGCDAELVPIDVAPDFAAALVIPAEFDLTDASGSRRRPSASRLQIAVQHAAVEELDPRGALDVAVQLAADDVNGAWPRNAGRSAWRRLRWGEIALHVHVAA
jgi:hypothetical protein